MSIFKKTKLTEEQKSALTLMRANYNKGIEEKEIGAFHERFNQFSVAEVHYRKAYNHFVDAEEMAKLAGDDKMMDRIVAYKSFTSDKVADMEGYARNGDNRIL